MLDRGHGWCPLFAPFKAWNSDTRYSASSTMALVWMRLRSAATSGHRLHETLFRLCRSMCTMYSYTVVCGNTASIASGNTFRPST